MSKSSTEPGPGTTLEFPAHIELCLRDVRGALTELLSSVGADPGEPQGIARRFGINRNLAWRVSKVVNELDVLGAAPHVPRPPGSKLLLDALGSGGAPAVVLDQARRALEQYEAMVKLHAGDRANLDLLLTSMLPDRVEAKALEANRKLSFQGNSGTWGVQARTQLTTNVVHPSADPGLVSTATIQGFVDFRRLRSTATWPVARFQILHGDAGAEEPGLRPLDPRCRDLTEPPILEDYCAGNSPELSVVPIEGGSEVVLGRGPVGMTATETCLTGVVSDGMAPRYATRPGVTASFWSNLHTPVEFLQFDLLLHKDLGYGQPEVSLLSSMESGRVLPLDWKAVEPLPLTERVESLGAGPPVVTSPLFARYRDLVTDCVRYAGHELEEYEGWRFVLSYPPIPTRVCLSLSLPFLPE